MGAVFGLSVVPVFAKEAAPKPAPAPNLDSENPAKIIDATSGVAAAVCAGAIHTGFFSLGLICGAVVVVLLEDLFHYRYPFRIPDLFEIDLNNRKLSKYENLVRVEFIKTFSSRDVEKPFYIREFLNTYKISNQKIKEIKQIFIDIIHIFQQYQLIEKEGLLMLNRSPINIYDLNTSNISDGIILYEKITTNLFLIDKV